MRQTRGDGAPGTPSWGALMRQGLENMLFYPHLLIVPIAALAMTLYSVVMIGEAVRAARPGKPGAPVRLWGRSSVGRALESHSRGQGFDSPRLHSAATVAQLVEHVTRNDGVVGSSPTGGS